MTSASNTVNKFQGNYYLYEPEKEIQIGDVHATGDIKVQAQSGTTGKLTSENGAISVSMIDPTTPPDLLAAVNALRSRMVKPK